MPLDGEYTPDVKQKDEVAKVPPHIRCPHCRWKVDGKPRWQCHVGCWHRWNTFDTDAKCPSCGCQWEDTICPFCKKWSLHQDWYGT